ncbi:MAG TPA: NADH-quinone oxidoreductase subunit M, partial [Thermoanaerobaculia bacterium]|nr:NADH-quinone oxidoreductase subunit M [Thermoanaerobaculia bacterium]
ILLKMGTYGFMRIVLPLFPNIVLDAVVQAVVLGLAVAGIVYAALVALVQEDFKRLVAYSSVSHMGFAMLGIFALSVESLQGAMMVQLAHGLSSGALFLLIGMIYDRRHSRQLDAYGGIARVMPLYAAFLMVATLSSVAVPGTFGFVGEFLVLIGSFGRYPILTVVATTGVILSAAYMLWSVQRILFNRLDKPENRRLSDLNWREAGMLIPLSALIIWIGIYPGPILRVVEPSVVRLVEQVHTGATVRTSTVAAEGVR